MSYDFGNYNLCFDHSHKICNQEELSPNITAMVNHFNCLALLVPTEILAEDTPQMRAKVIAIFIKVSLCGTLTWQSLHALSGNAEADTGGGGGGVEMKFTINFHHIWTQQYHIWSKLNIISTLTSTETSSLMASGCRGMPPAQELPLLEGRVGRSAVHAYLQAKEIMEESSSPANEVLSDAHVCC